MIVLPLVVWGEEWIKRSKFCLASLKAEGNLPDTDTKLVIYTNNPEEFPGYLTRPIPQTHLRKHKVTTYCYKHAIEEWGKPLAPIACDMICSTGLLDTIHRHHKEGKRLLCAPVPRTNEKTFLSSLPNDCWKITDKLEIGVISLGPRQLAQMAMDHQHQGQVDRMFLDKIPSRGQPTTIFRRVGNTLQCNCFHMHPILFDPPADFEVHGGIDGHGVSVIPDEQTVLLSDSDDGLVVDFTNPDYEWNGAWANEIWPVVSWAKRVTVHKHRWLFQHDCYIHSDGVNTLPPDERLTKLKQEVSDLDKLMTT